MTDGVYQTVRNISVSTGFDIARTFDVNPVIVPPGSDIKVGVYSLSDSASELEVEIDILILSP